MFTSESILQLFKKQWHNAKLSEIKKIVGEAGGISAFEAVLMYLYILDTRPRHVIEFSPNHGYSTQAIAMAQRKMRNRWAFATFDISKGACGICETRLGGLELSDYCNVIQGNANVEIPKYIKQKYALVDFCFIDSDHRAAFAKNYIEEIFPLLQPGCLVGVHDIAATKLSDGGITAYQSSLHGGKYSGGEESPVRSYIVKNKLEFSVLHALCGGSHEKANLPINQDFYNQVQCITNIDFRKCPGKACPKSLWFKLN